MSRTRSSKALVEQADGYSSSYHRFIKKKKNKIERKRAKEALRNGKEPVNGYNKYRGYEL